MLIRAKHRSGIMAAHCAAILYGCVPWRHDPFHPCPDSSLCAEWHGKPYIQLFPLCLVSGRYGRVHGDGGGRVLFWFADDFYFFRRSLADQPDGCKKNRCRCSRSEGIIKNGSEQGNRERFVEIIYNENDYYSRKRTSTNGQRLTSFNAARCLPV